NFTKIRLRGTMLHEPEDGYAATSEMRGIYVDVFYMDNVPDNWFQSRMQYVLAKYYLCYQLAQRTYKQTTFKKKLMIAFAAPLQIGFIRRAVVRFIDKFNREETARLGFYYGRTRCKTAIVSRRIYGTPKYVPFEDTELPVPENYHEYLTQMFGDYMKLPPEEQRRGFHLISVDFGQY
ncbi:MAG: LicD family protein, partial [Bacteroidales bacterium]|nr:LicD family protein [Bacteroidales bacterium]